MAAAGLGVIMTTNIPDVIHTDEMSDSQRRLIMSLAINDLQTKVGRLYEAVITGNGNISLLERMRNAEKFIANIQYWSRFLVGALIIQTLAFLGGVLVALIRFLPVLEQLAAQP
jgi:hypothetical protein